MAPASIPQGWEYVSDWCIRSADGNWTICKYGIANNRYMYEIWNIKNQIAVGMSTAQDAIRLHTSLTKETNLSQELGVKSSISAAGDQAELL